MVDALCYDDLDPNGTELDDPEAELEQDCYHRIFEEPGSNLDDPDRGAGLDAVLSGTVDTAVGDLVEYELRKDDRVDAVRASTTILDSSNAGASVQLDIVIEPGGSLTVKAGGG